MVSGYKRSGVQQGRHDKSQSPSTLPRARPLSLTLGGSLRLDSYQWTARCYASGNYRGLETLQLLVSKGTAINVRDLRLRTPLGYTARLGHLQHAKYLLGCGANPSIPDEYNVIPIFDTVQNNFHDLLELFIAVSNLIEIRPFGSSLLHWIAANADTTTLNIILKSNLSQMFLHSDVLATNAEGLTPLEVLNDRPTVTKDEREEFQALAEQISQLSELTKHIKTANTAMEPDELSDIEIVWFDAAETGVEEEELPVLSDVEG